MSLCQYSPHLECLPLFQSFLRNKEASYAPWLASSMMHDSILMAFTIELYQTLTSNTAVKSYVDDL
jgi:hypothetical protein